ncbi:MAG: hypothetical protein EZS28_005970 [Streblomastix strix]|uniref:Transmembrane protein n=1 Tax=Streblomastix strix TaxID=222440 RepID=A0A5J4WTY6_9EUKA|nr:MAG: hypothetical protein EZS28_005970 [Streblomastix strix]
MKKAQNDLLGLDANKANQLESEQKDNEGQDDNYKNEGGKTLQKSDSLSDVNILTNKFSTKSASQSTSSVVRTGSQKSEILKKLQTKQTKQYQTFILIFSFLFISLVLMIVLFIFLYIYIFIGTNFISAVYAGRAFRRAIVVAELMNTALDYSRYYMFEVLMVDQDGGIQVDGVYGEATGVSYPLLIELNQEYDQLYQWGYYNQVC